MIRIESLATKKIVMNVIIVVTAPIDDVLGVCRQIITVRSYSIIILWRVIRWPVFDSQKRIEEYGVVSGWVVVEREDKNSVLYTKTYTSKRDFVIVNAR